MGSGRVSVSGADFLRGRSLGTGRKSGASVESGVDGALEGPQDARGVSLMVMAGGKEPIFLLVASCVTRSYSRTSSMLMSTEERHTDRQQQITHSLTQGGIKAIL